MAAGCNIGAHDIIFTPYCQRKNKIFNTLLKVLALWALLIPASAQVYKWVDENGRTHYGERPPQNAKAREVEQRLASPGPAAGTANPSNWKEKDLEFRGRRIQAEQAETKQKQQEAAEIQACNQARDSLSRMKSARRMYRLDEKGGRVYRDNEESQATIAQMEQRIGQYCR
jgi:hypothetical protein